MKNKVWTAIAAIILAIIFISPFYLLLVNSFKTQKGIFTDVIGLPGESFTFKNYVEAFKQLEFVKSFTNSL